MKFLLTNDDGIEAPGLAMLEQALSKLGKVAVVATHNPLSGCSHQVSTKARVPCVPPLQLLTEATIFYRSTFE